VHNGGWYNKAGEKLGWGDLSVKDMKYICDSLNADELFIILGEQESFWDFVSDLGHSAQTATTRPEIDAPGVDYVAEHALYILAKGKLHVVAHYLQVKDDEPVQVRWDDDRQLVARYIRPENVKSLITEYAG